MYFFLDLYLGICQKKSIVQSILVTNYPLHFTREINFFKLLLSFHANDVNLSLLFVLIKCEIL